MQLCIAIDILLARFIFDSISTFLVKISPTSIKGTEKSVDLSLSRRDKSADFSLPYKKIGRRLRSQNSFDG